MLFPMIIATTPTPTEREAVREAATTFLIVSLLLLALFVVIALVMVVRRRRISVANARTDQRSNDQGAEIADAWESAGERAEPYDSRDD